MDSTKCFGDFKLQNTELIKCADRKLKENTWYKFLLDYLEYSTETNRVRLVTGSCSLLLATVLLVYGTQLICDVVGFLYPGYETMKALENFDVQQSKKWMRYWIVISAFIFVERFLLFLPLFPGYWIMKCIIFIFCYNYSISGADIIYSLVIYPLYEKYQELVCNALYHFIMTVVPICSKEYVKSNEVLMPRDYNEVLKSGGRKRVLKLTDDNEAPKTRDDSEVPMLTDDNEVPKATDDSKAPMITDNVVPKATDDSKISMITNFNEVPKARDDSKVPMLTDDNEVPKAADGSNVPLPTDDNEVPKGRYDSKVPMLTDFNEVPKARDSSSNTYRWERSS